MDSEIVQRIKGKDVNLDYQTTLKAYNECGFNKIELESILRLFKRLDINKIGSIQFHDLMEILNG